MEVRSQRVDAEARRLAGLGAAMAAVLFEEGSITTGSRCGTRRATSSISTEG
jgi:hypothetical protein